MSDSVEMDGVSPTPEDFFDHEPTKHEKHEVGLLPGDDERTESLILASGFR
jgi:hypothetical protein